ncbi:MAG: prephenate dehydratase, partial [Alphaproteobacteria bacterium HGW-Alphaproteobacteria-3]
TRFIIMAKEPDDAGPDEGPVITSFIFRVRNVPAALYKALGGFATNGVNMTKLESYQLEGTFNASQFYADIEGHPDSRNVRLALEELEFFTNELRILGIYKAHPYRAAIAAGE